MKKTAWVALASVLVTAMWLAGATEAKPGPARTRPALLVIDVQNAYLPYMDEKDKNMAMEGINYYIGLFRASGFPVIRVYHTDPAGGPPAGSEAFAFAKTVAVRDDDAMVTKNFPSAFKKTDLDRLLKAKGCNTLFLCGLSAVGCVLATYHGALDLDYDAFMLKGALISHDAGLTKAVQEICRTADYYSLKLLLENIAK